MKTIFSLFAFLIIATAVNAQADTTYFDKNWEISTSINASFYRLSTKDIEGYSVVDYFMDGKMRMMARCNGTDPMVKNGPCAFYNQDGKIESYGNYKDNNPIGTWVWPDKNGKDSTVAEYGSEGTKTFTHISRQTVSDNGVFEAVEVMPEFPGGSDALMQYVLKNYKIPAQNKKEKAEGRIIVSFVVDKYGKAIDPKIVKSVSPSCDQEALRLIERMPKWQPGKQKGKNVAVQFNLPIVIKLH